jgi:hypothetical protein
VVAGVVTAVLLDTGAEVHPPSAAMHTITTATTAREHSDRRAGCERHPNDGRPPPGYAAVVTPSSTQSGRSRFPPRPDQTTDFDDAECAILRSVEHLHALDGKQKNRRSASSDERRRCGYVQPQSKAVAQRGD